jgi:hypothetical protein
LRLYQRLLRPIALAIALVVFACGRPQPTPTSTPTPLNLEALLQESGKVMEDLDSFHFELTHRSGSTPMLPNLSVREAAGDVVKPDKLSVSFSGAFGSFAVKSSVIAIGDSSYMTNPLTGRWESIANEVSPLGFFNPREGIAAIMSQVTQVSLVSADAEALRLRGTLPAEALAPLLGAAVQGTTIAVELKLDARQLYLLEAVLDGRVTALEPDGVVRLITLSRFNQPTAIEPPQQ